MVLSKPAKLLDINPTFFPELKARWDLYLMNCAGLEIFQSLRYVKVVFNFISKTTEKCTELNRTLEDRN